jgi:hypothetical protein
LRVWLDGSSRRRGYIFDVRRGCYTHAQLLTKAEARVTLIQTKMKEALRDGWLPKRCTPDTELLLSVLISFLIIFIFSSRHSLLTHCCLVRHDWVMTSRRSLFPSPRVTSTSESKRFNGWSGISSSHGESIRQLLRDFDCDDHALPHDLQSPSLIYAPLTASSLRVPSNLPAPSLPVPPSSGSDSALPKTTVTGGHGATAPGTAAAPTHAPKPPSHKSTSHAPSEAATAAFSKGDDAPSETTKRRLLLVTLFGSEQYLQSKSSSSTAAAASSSSSSVASPAQPLTIVVIYAAPLYSLIESSLTSVYSTLSARHRNLDPLPSKPIVTNNFVIPPQTISSPSTTAASPPSSISITSDDTSSSSTAGVPSKGGRAQWTREQRQEWARHNRPAHLPPLGETPASPAVATAAPSTPTLSSSPSPATPSPSPLSPSLPSVVVESTVAAESKVEIKKAGSTKSDKSSKSSTAVAATSASKGKGKEDEVGSVHLHTPFIPQPVATGVSMLCRETYIPSSSQSSGDDLDDVKEEKSDTSSTSPPSIVAIPTTESILDGTINVRYYEIGEFVRGVIGGDSSLIDILLQSYDQSLWYDSIYWPQLSRLLLNHNPSSSASSSPSGPTLFNATYIRTCTGQAQVNPSRLQACLFVLSNMNVIGSIE